MLEEPEPHLLQEGLGEVQSVLHGLHGHLQRPLHELRVSTTHALSQDLLQAGQALEKKCTRFRYLRILRHTLSCKSK